jgi:hypothetical protein
MRLVILLKKFGAGDRGRTGDVKVIFGTSPNRAFELMGSFELTLQNHDNSKSMFKRSLRLPLCVVTSCIMRF